MTTTTRMTVLLALVAAFIATSLMPLAAMADQKSKNNWRNLAIGSGALGVYGLASHQGGLALLGAAGAAYSANRYEQDRHHQSQAQRRWRHEHYHRYYGHATRGYWYHGHYYVYHR